MSTRRWLLTIVVLLLANTPILAENHQVNCDYGEKLAKALEEVKPGETIQVSGTCQEAVTIITDRITINALIGFRGLMPQHCPRIRTHF